MSDRADAIRRVLWVDASESAAQDVLTCLAGVSEPSPSIIRAKSIDEGLDQRAIRPDVVLLSLSFPESPGEATLSLVPRFNEDAAVIILADAGEESLARASLRYEAQDFLIRGQFSPASMRHCLRNALERHRLLRVHHRTENRFRRLMTDSPDGVLVVDPQGRLLYMNVLAVEMFPRLRIGESVAKVGIQVPGPSEELVALDDERRLEVRSSRIDWNGTAAWLVMLRDESIRAQLDDLRARLSQSEKLAVIGQMAAGVAHEINNPLAFILANLSATLGQVHSLEDVLAGARRAARLPSGGRGEPVSSILDRAGPDLFAELKEMLTDNIDGVHRIRSIVGELKSFSRREDEEQELISVHDIVKSACRMIAPQIRHRGALVKQLNDVKPVMGNRVKLVQILTNLLMNAAQALPEHRGDQEQVTIHTRHDDRWVIISVTDSGTGIDDRLKDRIFEPFFTTKSRDAGTGIGLSLSAELARQHDGELVLVDTSPSGSTFELRLPAVDAARLVHSVAAPPKPTPIVPAVSRRRILLVDDEPNVRKSMLRILRDYEVVATSDGREALEALEEQTFDAIICDLVMPDIDGVDLHEALERERPEMLGRVIYTSGGAYTPRTAAFVAQAGVVFVEKPVHPGRMRSLLEKVIH